jgi:hypothetical protein
VVYDKCIERHGKQIDRLIGYSSDALNDLDRLLIAWDRSPGFERQLQQLQLTFCEENEREYFVALRDVLLSETFGIALVSSGSFKLATHYRIQFQQNDQRIVVDVDAPGMEFNEREHTFKLLQAYDKIERHIRRAESRYESSGTNATLSDLVEIPRSVIQPLSRGEAET